MQAPPAQRPTLLQLRWTRWRTAPPAWPGGAPASAPHSGAPRLPGQARRPEACDLTLRQACWLSLLRWSEAWGRAQERTMQSAADLIGAGEGRLPQALVAKQGARACGGPAVLSVDHRWPGVLRVRWGAHGPAVRGANHPFTCLSGTPALSSCPYALQVLHCMEVARYTLHTPSYQRAWTHKKCLPHTGWAAAGMQHSRASAAARSWPGIPGARCCCRRM